MTDRSDEEIIISCRQKGCTHEGLTLFITHFNELIDKTIVDALGSPKASKSSVPSKSTKKSKSRKLMKSRRFYPDADIVRDIGLEIVEKLTCPTVFNKIINADKPAGYLVTIIQNHIADWIRREKSNRHATRICAEQNLHSLSDPVYIERDEASNLTLEDVCPDPRTKIRQVEQEADEGERNRQKAESVWKYIDNLSDSHRLIMLSLLMEFRPFSSETIDEIARRRQVTADIVQKDIDVIKNDLARRRKEREEAEGKAIQLFAEILLLRKRLYAMTHDPKTDKNAIHKIQKKIEKKQAARRRHLKDMETAFRTPSKQIVGLLGLPENQAKTINTLFKRIREALRE